MTKKKTPAPAPDVPSSVNLPAPPVEIGADFFGATPSEFASLPPPPPAIDVLIDTVNFTVMLRDPNTGDSLREQSVQAVLLAQILDELRRTRMGL